MKKVEIESLLKSFFLFFLSQTLLIGALFFMQYNQEVKNFDNELFNKMRICSFDLKCKKLQIDFVEKGKYELYKLYKKDKEIVSYFSISNSKKNSLKIYITNKEYNLKLQVIKDKIINVFLLVILLVSILSLLFSVYSLHPFRQALKLTEEFIKDILHDFNTPLSTIRLNISMLKTEIGTNSKLTRVENNVQNILNLRSNLRSYLLNHQLQQESLDLKDFIQDRVSFVDKKANNIDFIVDIKSVNIAVNKDSFTRIIDNIISNAIKYNKKDGQVNISLKDSILSISDTGKGIKDTKRIFQRFYKEQDRGIGIGLHIVKKLCEELGIGISVESKIDKGTSFYLNLKNQMSN